MLEDDKDPDTREFALDLIKKSAATASAKLQFSRLAFGAAGSAGAAIDTGDAEKVTRGLLTDDRVKLDWRAARVLMPKNEVKLLLNMCLIAIAAIPRGGVITVWTDAGDAKLRVTAAGTHMRIAHGVRDLAEGRVENGLLDAHAIQPYYTFLVAQSAGLRMHVAQETDAVVLEAQSVATLSAPDADLAASA